MLRLGLGDAMGESRTIHSANGLFANAENQMSFTSGADRHLTSVAHLANAGKVLPECLR